MNQTLEVIRALDDSMGRSISYRNRSWLYNNVEKENITVKQGVALHLYIFEFMEKALSKGSMIIQNGKKLRINAEFNPLKEALILEKNSEDKGYFAFFYSPAIYNSNLPEE